MNSKHTGIKIVMSCLAFFGAWQVLQKLPVNELFALLAAGVIPGTNKALSPNMMLLLAAIVLLLSALLIFRKEIMRGMIALKRLTPQKLRYEAVDTLPTPTQVPEQHISIPQAVVAVEPIQPVEPIVSAAEAAVMPPSVIDVPSEPMVAVEPIVIEPEPVTTSASVWTATVANLSVPQAVPDSLSSQHTPGPETSRSTVHALWPFIAVFEAVRSVVLYVTKVSVMSVALFVFTVLRTIGKIARAMGYLVYNLTRILVSALVTLARGVVLAIRLLGRGLWWLLGTVVRLGIAGITLYFRIVWRAVVLAGRFVWIAGLVTGAIFFAAAALIIEFSGRFARWSRPYTARFERWLSGRLNEHELFHVASVIARENARMAAKTYKKSAVLIQPPQNTNSRKRAYHKQ